MLFLNENNILIIYCVFNHTISTCADNKDVDFNYSPM